MGCAAASDLDGWRQEANRYGNWVAALKDDDIADSVHTCDAVAAASYKLPK